MSGIGFVRDAQTQARQNRDNLKNRSSFQKTYKFKIPKKRLRFKKATPEELERLRVNFLARKRQRTVNLAIAMIFSFLVLAWLVWFVFF